MPIKTLLLVLGLFITGLANAVPVIQTWETANGARVYFVAAHEIPMVDIQVVFDAGAARDQDKPGLALMTNALLPEGAGGLNADEIAERFDNLGAGFGNQSHRDMSVLSLRSLVEPKLLNPALQTLATVLTKPDFPVDAFNREKNRLLISLRARKQSPDDIAEEAFYEAVYGNHPYASFPTGTEDSIKNLKLEDLIQFHKQFYVAKNAVIAIVGDLDRSRAEQLVNTLVGKLPAGQTAPDLPKVEQLKSPQQEKIEHPSTQTHILMGQPGMRRSDPDYFALYVGNHVLGGSGLVSRISDEIREKRGLSYSAYSYFSPMRELGPYIIGLQTRNDAADEALKVLRETVKQFVDNGPTPQELDAAKKNITGGFALRVSSNKKIVEYLAMIGFYGLPLDYLDKFNDQVQAVTLEQVKSAFRRRVNPDSMATVIVGGSADSG